MTPEILARIGALLYGSHWHADLARSLGVTIRTVQRWDEGARGIPEIGLVLATLCDKRAAALETAAEVLRGEE